LPSFVSALKERRIVQIVASYAVSGWVALQVVGELVERGIIPDVFYRVGFILFLGGFFASAVLGWYHGEKGDQKATPLEIALLVVVTVVTGAFGVRTVQDARLAARVDSGSDGTFDVSRIAVMYFTDQSRTGELGYLADGLTESLIERLSDVSGLDVVSVSGSARFRDSDLPNDSIAAILSTGTLVRGFVEPRGDDVRVSVVLIDGETGDDLQRQTLDEPADELFALQDGLADQVGELLRSWLGAELTVRRARRGTDNVAAWATYRRGLRARREANLRIAEGDIQGFISEFQRSDSLLIAAGDMDPEWTDPLLVRARLAFRWGELSVDEPAEALEMFGLAIERANAVIAREPNNGMAHYVRGLTQYVMWNYGLLTDPVEAARAFDAAEQDLETAVQYEATLASAWNILSQIRSQKADIVGANIAARSAYESDQFLSSAESVLRTLYTTSYDLENFGQAISYCDEGRKRFPDNELFTECQLWLMATRNVEPDPERAWEIRSTYLDMVGHDERAAISSQLVVAMILARADLPDSARAVAARSQASPAIDPTRELLGVEALVYLELDDPDTAMDRLSVYLTASPEHRSGWRWTSHWWWRELQDNPEFQRLMGS
jgi:eukaryotic-like serine/threonine-protein kinase